MSTEPVSRWLVLVLCVSCLAVLDGNCAFIKNIRGKVTVEDVQALIPASMVADGLSIVAYQGALKLAAEVPPDKQGPQVQRVHEVIDKLLVNEPELKKESEGWSVHIIDSDARDAVAFAGAGILVHRGLFDCDDTCLGKARSTRRAKQKKLPQGPSSGERVLAVALSHEISHLRAKHFEQRLRANAKMVKEATNAVQNALRAKAERLELPRTKAELAAALADIAIPGGTLKQLILIAGFSIAGEAGGHPFMVDQELVSDCEGSSLMRRAGYDPNDALAFWGATGSTDSDVFFPTHPRSEQRLAELERCIAALPTAAAQSGQVAAAHTKSRR